MKGASASRARRRAISVLPTPVGPIIRMFFGVISVRIGSATCWRRQRLRSAIATARFARPCPTMYLSSSCTISGGVMPPRPSFGFIPAPRKRGQSKLRDRAISRCKRPYRYFRKIALTPFPFSSFERLDAALLVGIDADVAGDCQRLVDDFFRRQRRILEQGPRRSLGIGSAGADGEDAVLGFEHVARAGDDERALLVGDGEHRLQPPQDAVGAPVLRQLDRGAHQVSLVLVELRLEALEERERVGGAAGEAREDALLVEPPHLARAALDYDLTERHLAVAAERDGCAAPD